MSDVKEFDESPKVEDGDTESATNTTESQTTETSEEVAVEKPSTETEAGAEPVVNDTLKVEAEASNLSPEEPEAISTLENKPFGHDTSSDAPHVTKKSKIFNRKIIVILTLIVIACGVSAFFLLQKEDVNQSTSSEQDSNQTSTQEAEVVKIEEVPNTVTVEGIAWLSEPEQIAYQDIFNEESLTQWTVGFGGGSFDEAKANTRFFKIGTYKNSDVFIVALDFVQYVFLRDGDSYTLIVKDSSPDSNGQYSGPLLKDFVTVDKETSFKELQVPSTLRYGGATIQKIGNPSYYDAERLKDLAMSKVADSDYGSIFESAPESEYSEGVKQLTIYLKIKTGMYVPFRYDFTILNDDNSIKITWNDGTETTDAYRWETISGGCGLVESVNVLDKNYFNDLKEIGKAGSTTILSFKDTTSDAFKTIYDNVFYDDAEKAKNPMQKFLDDKGVIVFRNELGYRAILTSTKYTAGGECGKPVIYLYPEQTTNLQLKVGADVKVSEPEYGQGWNVTAYPDGKLKVGSQLFDSLYWEGKGNGKYPDITEGTIVQKSQLEATLWQQLEELGLNKKESADFMEYWLPRMPDTPYTRITWFGTKQMNALAPLTISLQPDTMIRVFIDFEGLNQPISIPAQKLGRIERRGFTLVEWGGLLRDGLK